MENDVYEGVGKEIVGSTEEIFSAMIPMEIKTDEAFMQDESLIRTDLMSLVSFTGEHSGIIALFCSKEIALMITSSMLGISATELDQDTKDAIGEVTNMIAGSLKNKVHDKFGAMHLSVPIVIGGADITISSSAGEQQKVNIAATVTCSSQSSWMMTPFSSNGQTFNVGLIVKKND